MFLDSSTLPFLPESPLATPHMYTRACTDISVHPPNDGHYRHEIVKYPLVPFRWIAFHSGMWYCCSGPNKNTEDWYDRALVQVLRNLRGCKTQIWKFCSHCWCFKVVNVYHSQLIQATQIYDPGIIPWVPNTAVLYISPPREATHPYHLGGNDQVIHK